MGSQLAITCCLFIYYSITFLHAVSIWTTLLCLPHCSDKQRLRKTERLGAGGTGSKVISRGFGGRQERGEGLSRDLHCLALVPNICGEDEARRGGSWWYRTLA